MHRTFGMLAIVVAAGLCGSTAGAATLKLGVATDALTLDPIATSDDPSIWAQLLLYDTLVRPTVDGKALEPDLAESWQGNPQGTEFTFHLRAAKFSDGTPVTAADVVASLKRASSPSSQWARFFKPITGYSVIDDHTVRLTLDKPFTPLLNNLALFSSAIIPARQAEAAKLPDRPTGSGPFVMRDWRHGDRMVLARNPNYWQAGKPSVDEADLVVVGEDNSRVLQLQSGDLDVAIQVPFNLVAQLKASPDLQVGSAAVFRSDFVMLNTRKKPFDDQRVRQALNYATDRQGLVDGVLAGNGTVASSAMPVMACHDPSLAPYAHDVGKAKALLQQAGLAGGFAATMLVPSGDATAQQVAVALQSDLAKIGVRVTLQQIEEGTQWDVTKKGDYEMSLSYATSDTIDPDQLFGFLAVNPERADAYHTFWKNDRLNALYRAGAQHPGRPGALRPVPGDGAPAARRRPVHLPL